MCDSPLHTNSTPVVPPNIIWITTFLSFGQRCIVTRYKWYSRKAVSKASWRTLSPQKVAEIKAVKELLFKADITSIVSGHVFSENFLWDLLPSVAENYSTILVKAKGDLALLFGLEKIVASFYSRVKVMKPSSLPALGEADGEEGEARDESDEDEAGDAIDEVGNASNEDKDADGEQQSRVNKHGAQISKIKHYSLDRCPTDEVRTLGRENMADFGERCRSDLAELVETERLQQRTVFFQERVKDMAVRLVSILDKNADEGEEEPTHWETNFARLIA